MSPADRDDARLPARAEALLSEWPAAREETTKPGKSGHKRSRRGSLESQPKSSADLLRPPFPSSSGEDGPDPQRASSPKLSDIARAVRESKPDHNLTDVARVRSRLQARSQFDRDRQGEPVAGVPGSSRRHRRSRPECAPRRPRNRAAVATPLPESASAVPPPSGSKPPAQESPGNRRPPVIALLGRRPGTRRRGGVRRAHEERGAGQRRSRRARSRGPAGFGGAGQRRRRGVPRASTVDDLPGMAAGVESDGSSARGPSPADLAPSPGQNPQWRGAGKSCRSVRKHSRRRRSPWRSQRRNPSSSRPTAARGCPRSRRPARSRRPSAP